MAQVRDVTSWEIQIPDKSIKILSGDLIIEHANPKVAKARQFEYTKGNLTEKGILKIIRFDWISDIEWQALVTVKRMAMSPQDGDKPRQWDNVINYACKVVPYE